MNIFKDNVINIFTDASVLNNNTGETISCSGAVMVMNNEDVSDIRHSVQVLRDSTNNHGEIMAINLGIDFAIDITNYSRENNLPIPEINLFSDSKISVCGLRQWIFNWINCSTKGVMFSSSGKPVANQDIYKSIVYKIVINNINLNLYHQKGHVNERKEKSVINAQRVFNESNGTRVDNLDLIRRLSHYNNMIDQLTRDYLYIEKNEGLFNTKVENTRCPIIPQMDKNDIMGRYRRLVK